MSDFFLIGSLKVFNDHKMKCSLVTANLVYLYTPIQNDSEAHPTWRLLGDKLFAVLSSDGAQSFSTASYCHFLLL